MEDLFEKGNLQELSLSPETFGLKERLVKELSENHGYISHSVKQMIEETPEILENTEVLTEAKKIIINKLTDGNVHSALNLKNEFFKKRPEILEDNEVILAAKEAFTTKLFSDEIDNTNISDARLIMEGFLKNNRETVVEIAQNAFIKYFDIKNIEYSMQIKESFLQNQEAFFQSESVVLKAKEIFIEYLSIGYLENLYKIRKDYLFDQQGFFESDEVISAAKKGVLYQMSFGGDSDKKIREEYLSNHPDFFKSDEVINKAKECFLSTLGSNVISLSIEIKRNYLLEQPDFFKSDEVVSALKKRFYSDILSRFSHDSAKEIVREFLYDKPEIVKEMAREAFSNNVRSGKISDAEEIKNHFLGDEDSDFIIQESKESFIKFIEGLYYGVNHHTIAVELKEKFLSNQESFFESDEVVHAVKNGLKKRIENKEYFDSFKKIRDSFLSGHSEIIEELIEEALIKKITSNDYDTAKNIKEEFIDEYPLVFESGAVLVALKDYMIRSLSESKKYGASYVDSKKIENDFLQNHGDVVMQASHEAVMVLLSKLDTDNNINRQEVVDTMRKLKTTYLEAFAGKEVLFQAEQNFNKIFSFKDYLEFQDIVNEFFESNAEQLTLSFLLKKLFECIYTENNDIEHIKTELESKFPEYKDGDKLRILFEEELFDKLKTGEVFDATKLKKSFPEFEIDILSNQERLQQIKESFIRALEDGSTGIVLEYINEFLGEEYKNFGDLKDPALKCLEQIKNNGTINGENMIIIAELFLQDEVGNPKLNKIIVESIFEDSLPNGRVDEAKKNADYFLRDYSLVENIQDILQDKLLGASYKISREDFIAIFGEVLPKEAEEENLTYIENIQNYFSNQGKEDVKELEGEEKYKRMFENLTGLKDTVWDTEGENHEIAKAFEEGANIFGYEKMFGFIGTHDRYERISYFREIILEYPNLEQFKNIEDVAYRVYLERLTDGNLSKALEIQDKFLISNEILNMQEIQKAVYSGFLKLLKSGEILKAYELQSEFSLRLSPIENKALELFGIFLTYDIFSEIKDLEKGIIGKELKKIGIKKHGEAGVLEITEKMRGLKSKFAKHNPEELDFENSEFMTNYFLAYTCYQNSSWGSTSKNSFLSTVNTIKSENYPPLRKEFGIIGTYQINKKEKSSSIDKSMYRQDFLERFSILLKDIIKAKDNLENKKPFSVLCEELENKKNDTIEALKAKIRELADNPQAQIGLNNRIKLLEKINIRSIKDFQENFKILSSFKELESSLRQVVFSMGFVKNKAQIEKDLAGISPKTPTLDDISWVINFVDHITNQETMAQYFTDKQAKKKFEKIINPSVLIEQMQILQSGQKTSGTMDITFSTHRDLHTEISGQVGDACWASKYQSILRSFPNFSSILMIKDKGGKFEKIVGSSLLIETKAENGDKLLIIRGLNPQENTINALDVESYFSAVVDYVKKLAEKTGKKVAISIDDHSGGHTTNRPVLFNFIDSLESKFLKRVRLLDPQESVFNGYNLQGDVYLLSDNLSKNFVIKSCEDTEQKDFSYDILKKYRNHTKNTAMRNAFKRAKGKK